MVWSLDGCTPESHDAVTHVLINRAPVAADPIGQTAKDRVEQRLKLGRLHGFGHLREPTHVAKHHGELFGCRLHAVAVRVLDHLIHQLRGNISSE